MKIKTLLHSCSVSYIDIILRYYVRDVGVQQIDIEIRNRKDFYNFIATYGDSDVYDWTMESVEGIPYMLFDLKNLVEKVQPKNKEELKKIIEETIEKEGYNCNLNFIDVSLVEDMSCLFKESQFNGDISNWNVSNVKNMCAMFYKTQFNGDISKWDVSNVEDMSYMFYGSQFNKDISKWNIPNDCYKEGMFNQ